MSDAKVWVSTGHPDQSGLRCVRSLTDELSMLLKVTNHLNYQRGSWYSMLMSYFNVLDLNIIFENQFEINFMH